MDAAEELYEREAKAHRLSSASLKRGQGEGEKNG